MAAPPVGEASDDDVPGVESADGMTGAEELGFDAMTEEELDQLLAEMEEEDELNLAGDTDAAGRIELPGDHAPIGVMQDHLHDKGDWMLSYRFMRHDMGGNRKAVERVDDADVLSVDGFGFSETPTTLTMETHMFGLMYGVTDSVTVAAMVPFVEQEMKHLTRSGERFTTESSGLADITVAALVRIYEDDTSQAHLNLGFSAPTGSITETDTTFSSAPDETILPYPMQLGSGTWDLRPGITYTGQEPGWSWGTQALATLRLGRNDRDYSLGDRLDLTAWGAWHATDVVSFSTRMALSRVKNIDGADSELDAAANPAADPTLRAGTRLDAFVGVNAVLGAGNRLAVEAGWPLSQNLSGPQLETDTMVTLGWQLSF